MMRVYEIAKLLGMRNKDLLRKIRALGLEVRSHMSPLGDDAVARIRLSIEAERASGGHSEPPHTAKVGLVARRRMAEDVDVQSAAGQHPTTKAAASTRSAVDDDTVKVMRGLWTSVAKEERAWLLVDLPAIDALWAGTGVEVAAVRSFVTRSLRASQAHTLYLQCRELLLRGAK